MKPVTAIIADDEPHLASHLREQLLALWPALDIVCVASSGTEAAAAIAGLEPDVAFLDIQMPGLTGLEVAQGIEGGTRVVFVTAYDCYAVQAFDEAAIDYLLKPLRRERLARAVARVQQSLAGSGAGSGGEPGYPASDERLAHAVHKLLQAQMPALQPARLHYIRASQGAVTHQVPVGDVLYFHSDEKYTVVHTRSGEHLIRTPIAELAVQLDPARFLQIHRATLVNQDYVDSVRRDDNSRMFVRLRGVDSELPVSRAYVHLFRAM